MISPSGNDRAAPDGVPDVAVVAGAVQIPSVGTPIVLLAEHQATTMDDWRDAEPGKMPHEIRFGELAHFHKIPHTPYYGTADATPLYLITLHETYLWTGDVGLLEQYRDVAERCLSWMRRA